MKALAFKRYGKSPEIGFADVPRRALKPDELLVQVHAAGLNPIDGRSERQPFDRPTHRHGARRRLKGAPLGSRSVERI